MNILITGGSGYIGIELVYSLSIEKDVKKIFIYDSFARSHSNVLCGSRKINGIFIEFIEGDILDNELLEEYIKKSDIVVHLAANVSTRYKDISSHQFEQINNWGSAVIANILKKYDNKKLIYLSTFEVYGKGKINPLSEKINPVTAYGISKSRGERHFLNENNNNKHIIARIPSVYGYSKNLRIDAPLNRLIFDAHFKNLIKINTSDDHLTPLIYMPVLNKYLKNLILKDHKSLINIAPAFDISTEELTKSLMNIYPNLEMIFLDQAIYLNTTSLSDEYIPSNESINQKECFEDSLREFKKAFVF